MAIRIVATSTILLIGLVGAGCGTDGFWTVDGGKETNCEKAGDCPDNNHGTGGGNGSGGGGGGYGYPFTFVVEVCFCDDGYVGVIARRHGWGGLVDSHGKGERERYGDCRDDVCALHCPGPFGCWV